MQKEALSEKLVSDVKEVISDSEELLKITASDLSEKTKEIQAQLSVRLEKAKVQLTEMKAELRDRAIAGAKETDRVIRANPYQSIGAALGFGLLLGAILNRR